MKSRYALFLSVFLLSMVGWCMSQEESKPSPPTESIGVYDTNFKYVEGRDPFENLTVSPQTVQSNRVIHDISDLLVEEVQIVGIYNRGGKYFVMARGAGLDRSYTVTIGQKFYNGEIMEVTNEPDKDGRLQTCVIFKQQTDDPIRPFIRVKKCVAGG